MISKFRNLFSIDKLHYLFLLIALPISFAYVFVVNPLQSNDEGGHFLRSIDVSYGNITDYDSISEGRNLPTVEGPITIIPFVNDASAVSREVDTNNDIHSLEPIKNLRWGNETSRLTDVFAVYPPVSYLFSSLGISFGKYFELTYSSTLYLGRLVNCLTSLFMLFIAIRICAKGRVFLFFIASLPSTLSLIASLSQDAFLLSVTALTIAVITQIKNCSDKKSIYTATSLLLLVVLIRPHYAPLILPFCFYLFSIKVKLKTVLTIAALCILPSLCWYLYVSPIMIKKMFPGVDEGKQLAFIIGNPLLFLSKLVSSVQNVWRLIYIPYISVSGLFISWMQPLLLLMTTVIFIINVINMRSKRDFLLGFIFILICFSSLFLFAITAYVSWTPVGDLDIQGIQGRYFIPILMFVTLMPMFISNEIDVKKIVGTTLIFAFFFILLIANVNSMILVTKHFVYR